MEVNSSPNIIMCGSVTLRKRRHDGAIVSERTNKLTQIDKASFWEFMLGAQIPHPVYNHVFKRQNCDELVLATHAQNCPSKETWFRNQNPEKNPNNPPEVTGFESRMVWDVRKIWEKPLHVWAWTFNYLNWTYSRLVQPHEKDLRFHESHLSRRERERERDDKGEQLVLMAPAGCLMLAVALKHE